MKQRDIALIIVVVFISAIVSIFVSKALFSPPADEQQVPVVKPLSADFPAPDAHYFNAQSIDPTILITIGGNSNSNPFSDSTQ